MTGTAEKWWEASDMPLLLNEAKGTPGPAARGENLIAVQLLSDAVERFDTVLQEIRHLQTNLIYAIRMGKLHGALLHEEKFIFGEIERVGGDKEKWSWLFGESGLDLGPGRLHLLGDIFVPRLPKPMDAHLFSDLVSDTTTVFSRLRTAAESDKFGQPKRSDGVEGQPPELDPGTGLRIWDFAAIEREVHQPIREALRQRFLSGNWDDQFRMNYDVLVALQALKRNLVIDKLHLCWWGWRSLIQGALPRSGAEPDKVSGIRSKTGQAPSGAMRRAQFFFVRAGALQNLRIYITRLADYHAQFEKTLDIGLQDNHRPITGRRREQGFYHFVLSAQTRELYELGLNLMFRISEQRDDWATDTRKRGMPTIIHRWQHDYTSTNQDLLDVARSRRIGKRPHDDSLVASYSVHTVNTSFWMPDRPDLQPVIMHETAHCVIRECLVNLSDRAVVSPNSPINDLARELFSILRGSYRVSDDQVDYTVREIMADILAVSISGPAYLFAVFQEFFGLGVEHIFRSSAWGEFADLSIARYVATNGFGDAELNVRWYIRLHAIVTWLELMAPGERRRKDMHNPLEEALCGGVRQACEELLAFLEHHMHPYHADWGRRIRKASIEIEGALTLSEMLAKTRRFSADRRKRPAGAPPHSLASPVRARMLEVLVGLKIATPKRAMHRLTDEFEQVQEGARNAIKKWSNPPKSASSTSCNDDPDTEIKTDKGKWCALQEFTAVYLSSGSEAKATFEDQWVQNSKTVSQAVARASVRLPLFNTLDDIAWQASMMRTMELTWRHLYEDPGGPSSKRCILHELSVDGAPGRTMHQIALEFWAFERRSSTDRLSVAVRLVKNLLALPTNHRRPYASDAADGNPGASVRAPFTESRLSRFLASGLGDEAHSKAEYLLQDALEDWLGSLTDPEFLEMIIVAELENELERSLDSRPQSQLPQAKEVLRAILGLLLPGLIRRAQLADAHERRKVAKALLRPARYKSVIPALFGTYLDAVIDQCPAQQILKLNSQFPFRPESYQEAEEGTIPGRAADWEEAFSDQLAACNESEEIKDLLMPLAGQAGKLLHYFAQNLLPTGRLDELVETALDAPMSHRQSGEAAQRKARRVGSQATLAKAAAKKIARLSEILSATYDGKDGKKCFRKYPTLLPLVSLCRQQRNVDLGRRKNRTLRLAISSLSNGHTAMRKVNSLHLSRISLINSHFWREGLDDRENDLGELALRSQEVSGPPQKWKRQFAVLGRYDYIAVSPDHEGFANSLPRFRTDGVQNGGEREFFERKDQALVSRVCGTPIRLVDPKMRYQDQDGVEKNEDYDVMAFMSLRLDRRTSRLEVLSRIRHACDWWRQVDRLKEDEPNILNQGTEFSDKLEEQGPQDDPKQWCKGFSRWLDTNDNPWGCPQFRDEINERLVNAIGSDHTPESMDKLLESVADSGMPPDVPVEALGPFFEDGDCALIGEGWPDIVLAFGLKRKDFTDPNNAAVRSYIRRRLFHVYAVQHVLFQDHAVDRTEMFLRPVALFGAGFDPARFSVSQQMRCREDREIDGSLKPLITTIKKAVEGLEDVDILQVPGRNDIEMTIRDLSFLLDPAKGSVPDTPRDLLDRLHRLAGARDRSGGGAFEEIITRVGLRR